MERYCMECGKLLSEADHLRRVCSECWSASQVVAAEAASKRSARLHAETQSGRQSGGIPVGKWSLWAISDLVAIGLMVPLMVEESRVAPPGADPVLLLLLLALSIAVIVLSIAAMVDASIKLRREMTRGALISLLVGLTALCGLALFGIVPR